MEIEKIGWNLVCKKAKAILQEFLREKPDGFEMLSEIFKNAICSCDKIAIR